MSMKCDVFSIPTLNLALQRVPVPLQLPFRAGTLQFDAGHLQLVWMFQTFNLKNKK